MSETDTPKDTWGSFSSGELQGHRIMVTKAAKGGWDLIIMPPPPARMMWNYWADDESQLSSFFNSDDNMDESAPWVQPGKFVGVLWDGVAPSADDFRRVGSDFEP